MPTAKTILKELRAEFLTATILPVSVATAAARHDTGSWDLQLFLLTLFGAVFLHLGTNTANDYYDHLSGADEANTEYARPFTGGSRLIQERAISPKGVLAIAVSCFAAAVAAGIILFLRSGPVILLFGVIGIFLGVFYTAPPVRLAARGLGEIAVFTGYWLIGLGTYVVQTGGAGLSSAVGAVPLGMLTAAIVIINEFQDMRSDRSAGKDTLVVRLGRRKAVRLFSFAIFGAYVPIIAAAATGMAPRMTLAALAGLLLAVKAVTTASAAYDTPGDLIIANALTVICHLITGILLTAAYIVSG